MSTGFGGFQCGLIKPVDSLAQSRRKAPAAQRFVQVAFREIDKSRRRRIESNELPGGRFAGDAAGTDVFNDGPHEERGRAVADLTDPAVEFYRETPAHTPRSQLHRSPAP